MKKIKVLLDTDLGGDCDDAGAIALLHVFEKQNKVEILGMTHTTSAKWGPAAIDIINKYYDNDKVEIGATTRDNFLNGDEYNTFLEKMYDNFESDYRNRDLVEDAVVLLRRKISEASDKVTIACIGQLNNLAELLKSGPCKYSQLTGIELVKEKVDTVFLMAGLFEKEVEYHGSLYDTEYNVVTDIDSAKFAIENTPVKMVFIDFIAGYRIKTFGPLLEEKDMDNPVTFAYYHFSNLARESWDPLTIYFMVFGESEDLKLSEYGTVSVGLEGKTSFKQSDDGLHRYVILNVKPEEIRDKIDQLIMDDLKERNRLK